MATRYSGGLKIHVAWVDREDRYKATVYWKENFQGRMRTRSIVEHIGHPPASRLAVDSPEAYDKVAHAAISFADDEQRGIGELARHDGRGWAISRKPDVGSPWTSGALALRENPASAKVVAVGLGALAVGLVAWAFWPKSAGASPTATVTPDDNGKNLALRVGDTVLLKTPPDDASTGATWSVGVDLAIGGPAALQLDSTASTRGPAGNSFLFRAVASNGASIRGGLARQGGPTVSPLPPLKTFTIGVTVWP